MPKIKTHRGAAKRIKKTGRGKYKASHANKNHILEKKTNKRKRHLCLLSFIKSSRIILTPFIVSILLNLKFLINPSLTSYKLLK